MKQFGVLWGVLLGLATGCAGHSVEVPTDEGMAGATGNTGKTPAAVAGAPDGGDDPAVKPDPNDEGGSIGTNNPSQSAGPDACGEPGNVVAVSTSDELIERMVGRWLYCSGVEIFAQRHDGIELRDDKTWAFLRYDANGDLQPQQGFDGGGTWTMLDTQEQNGPGSFQVNLDTSYGSNPSHMSFQDNPSAMRLSTTGGLTDYVAAE